MTNKTKLKQLEWMDRVRSPRPPTLEQLQRRYQIQSEIGRIAWPSSTLSEEERAEIRLRVRLSNRHVHVRIREFLRG